MKKVLTCILSILFSVNIAPSSVMASIKEGENNEVIAIVDGIEITRDDVNENGLINEDVFIEKEGIIAEDDTRPMSLSYPIPETLYVNKGSNALMIKKLVAPSFSQQTDVYYLNPDSAKLFAYELTKSTSLSIIGNNIIGLAIGYAVTSPHVGAIYAVGMMLKDLYLVGVRDEILNKAQNSSVKVSIIKSKYATLHRVETWNGTTVNTDLTNSNGATEAVHFYKSELQTGWRDMGGSWYYFNSNGIMQTGWQEINGAWYYLDPTYGYMKTGWQSIGGAWYYFWDGGSMAKGWVQVSGTWYYLDTTYGYMRTGWQQISGTWYYFYSSGAMATNTVIDGWKIDSNGVATKL